MTRQRMFLDMSCVDAARERIRHVYDTFDTVCVQFSGGKDSTAVLLLAKEVHDERGLGPVKVIFRDEEMLSPLIETYLHEIRALPWLEMEWYCLSMGTEIWVLGRREYVLTWSAQRAAEGRLIRPMPEWAIRAEHFGLPPGKVIPEPVDYYTMQGKTGRVAFLTGVRANESMIRYRSCVQKLHENYIVQPFGVKKSIPLRFAKVIYDWTTDDVFRFVAEHDFPYCAYYDAAATAQANTRVGIPLHAVAIRRLNDVVRTEPEFYDRLVECFPQIDAQRRLWGDYDMERRITGYAADGFDGLRRLIEENMLTPGIKRSAMNYVAEYRRKHVLDQWSYPIEWAARTLLLNEFTGVTRSPVGPKTKAHARRAAAQAELDALGEAIADAEADSYDAQDDNR